MDYSSYDFSLPYNDSNVYIPDASNYNLGGSYSDSNVNIAGSDDDYWYTDSGSSVDVGDDDNWWDSIWDWAGSNQGVAVLGGALDGLMSLWGAEKSSQLKSKSGGGGSNAAELQDERIKAHNASINMPMSMGAREFKKS
jgi:hypothetical protein